MGGYTHWCLRDATAFPAAAAASHLRSAFLSSGGEGEPPERSPCFDSDPRAGFAAALVTEGSPAPFSWPLRGFFGDEIAAAAAAAAAAMAALS